MKRWHWVVKRLIKTAALILVVLLVQTVGEIKMLKVEVARVKGIFDS